MARRKPAQIHGLAVVDKPAGFTSHDVVAVARRQLGERKIGHSGTLDPDATGVLLLGVGHLTRFLRYLTALGKTYTAEVVLGVETDTLDASGVVTARHEMVTTLEEVRAAAARFVGDIEQIPPMVSAVQVDGRRLHELAREGIEIERAARPVTVHRFDVESTADPSVYAIEVQCSSGTYVRTLAADLGRALGGGAHLRALRRTAVGSFTVDQAMALDAVGVDRLLSPLAAMADYPTVAVDDALAAMVRHGRVLPRDGRFVGEGPWMVAHGDELLAAYEPHGEMVKPAVVVPAEP
jgi:tRNA pseudouridine55 synthase